MFAYVCAPTNSTFSRNYSQQINNKDSIRRLIWSFIFHFSPRNIDTECYFIYPFSFYFMSFFSLLYFPIFKGQFKMNSTSEWKLNTMCFTFVLVIKYYMSTQFYFILFINESIYSRVESRRRAHLKETIK